MNNLLFHHKKRSPFLSRRVLVATFLFVCTVFLSTTVIRGIVKARSSEGVAITPTFLAQVIPGSSPIEENITEPPVPHVERPPIPRLTGATADEAQYDAKAIIVKDLKTGAILYSRDPYTARPIASITKLMSALVVLEHNFEWSDEAVVIGEDMLGTQVYKGDVFTMQELWDSALVASSNKSILTLANVVSSSSLPTFVERMNQKSQEMGMTSATFTEVTGLDAADMASAADVAILLHEALSKDQIRSAVLLKEVSLTSKERKKTQHMYNTNWLLLGWVPNTFAEIRGGKTGYIPEAGYNFATEVYDDKGHGLGIVILGAETHEGRFTQARDIANWTFANYTWP